ncbi:hypothetical protein AX16_011031 [Volvariella volvacea WC 439]|nr:hypothetical protein AX16_011031 [Volvariella volvacea WC 439]
MKLRTLISDIRLSLLPVISVGYLSFCWFVLYRTVLVPGSTYSVESLVAIRSGTTTISILTILLALHPMKSLIVDLKGEEFMRLLRTSSGGQHRGPGGVDLATANSVSSSSLGTITAFLIIIKRECSLYFIIAVLCGFIVTAISALAPAALSVHRVMLDSGAAMWMVAAIGPDSVAVVNNSTLRTYPTYQHYIPSTGMNNTLREAALVIWAEMAMNLTNSSFNPSIRTSESLEYIVPFPLGLSPTVFSRWVTDAFVLRPVCNWWQTDTEGLPLSRLFTNGTLIAHYESLGVALNLTSRFISADLDDFYSFEIHYASAALNGSYTIWDTTTNDIPSDGYSVWALLYRTSVPHWSVSLDLSTIPTFGSDLFRVAILACSPGFSIETVEARNEGGSIVVSPLKNTPSLGNLHQRQVELFFTTVFRELSRGTSPTPPEPLPAESKIQASLIFGWDQVSTGPLSTFPARTWYPMHIEDITEAYTRYLRSAMKFYMTGALGYRFTQGVISEPVLAFTASRGYVIASTVFLGILNIINLWAYFRSGRGEVFSLFTAASVLHGSNVLEEVRRVRGEHAGVNAEDMEYEFECEARGRFATLDRQGDADECGVLILHDAGTYPLN